MNEIRDRPRFTIRELALWTVVVCILLASPSWIGEHSAIITFYGMLTFSVWRLNKYINGGCAIVISAVIAILMTFATVWMINR